MESECVSERTDFAYRIYISDALKAFGRLNVRYYDIYRDMTEPPKEEITENEVISHISNMLENLGREE